MIMAFRHFLIWMIVCVAAALAFGAQAQDATTKDTTPPKAQTTQPSDAVDALPVSENAKQTIKEATGLDDETIDAKIKAADEAQREAHEALLEFYKQNSEGSENAAEESEDKAADQTQPQDEAEAKSLLPKNADQIKELGQKILDTVLGWLKSPAFLAQLGAVIFIWLILAPLISKQLRKRVFLLRDPPKEGDKFYFARKCLFDVRELVRPVLNIGLLALAAAVLKSTLGQDWLVKLAQGLAVVFLIYTFIKQFAPNELTRKIGLWVGIPLALMLVFGYFDNLLAFLDSISLGGGDNSFSVLTLIKLALYGSAFFWLGNYSNKKGQSAVRAQEALDVGVREIIAKFMQIGIFGAAAVMAMSAAGIGLGGLVVIFSALSLGVGLGLQPIAANFVSGMIILFDRSVKVGDFINIPDDQFGRVKAINMRSTTVITADGKDIIVPNTSFTEGAYENWTHDDPLQRYEVDFSVAYDTDLDALVPLIRDAVAAHKDVLVKPDEPSVEFRTFGESGINMCVEFWAEGIDDGPNKFTSDVGFIIWRTLKANKIQIPFPQRVIHQVK